MTQERNPSFPRKTQETTTPTEKTQLPDRKVPTPASAAGSSFKSPFSRPAPIHPTTGRIDPPSPRARARAPEPPRSAGGHPSNVDRVSTPGRVNTSPPTNVDRRPIPGRVGIQPSTNVDRHPSLQSGRDTSNPDRDGVSIATGSRLASNVDRNPVRSGERTTARQGIPQPPSFRRPPRGLTSPFDTLRPSRGCRPEGPSEDVMASVERARQRLIRRNPNLVSANGGRGVSETTLATYANRGRLLLNRFKRESGIPIDMDDFEPCDFAAWMLSLREEVKSSTWRLYRQGALYMIEAIPHPDVDEAIRMLTTDTASDLRQDSFFPPEDGRSREKRTSARKEKRFPKRDLERVIAYLDHVSRAKRAGDLRDWLIAGVNTGLRPIEWRATALEETGTGDSKRIWLHVLNAKATNGRGNGLARTIELTDYTPETLRAIRRMSERGLSWFERGEFDEIKGHVSQLLYHVCKKIFPDRKHLYALYSCRHQFIANMKSLYPLEEVSALVGHGTDVTTAERYGLRRNSWAPEDIPNRPRPLPEQVATVRRQMRFAEERRRIREAIGLPPRSGNAL